MCFEHISFFSILDSIVSFRVLDNPLTTLSLRNRGKHLIENGNVKGAIGFSQLLALGITPVNPGYCFIPLHHSLLN